MFLTFLEFLIFGCAVVVFFGLFMWIREVFLAYKFASQPLGNLPVNKKAYCQLVLNWCQDNIAHPTTTKPKLTIKYYRSKKWGGLYLFKSHECIIYVNSHQTILQVTNSVIHEYVHARQRNKQFSKQYEQFQQEVGYDKNPYEVEAREVAEKYQLECMNSILGEFSNR
jgi:hypothetical protein